MRRIYGLRISATLASLIVTAEVLLLSGVALAVDTDARIRATISAGEVIVGALEHYRRDHGQLPETLDRLVPRYVKTLPAPEYGAREWQFERIAAERPAADAPLSLDFDAGKAGDGSANGRQIPSLAVRLNERDSGAFLRRSPNGCWHFTGLTKCW